MARTLTDTATVAWDESEAGKLKANLVQSIDADTTLGGASPSDSALPTQKAIKAYVDANSVPASTDDNLGGNSASDLVAPTQKAAFTILNKRTAWSVKEFGATGLFGGDDTTAIQAALDSGEQHIWFPPGQYYISGPLTLPDAYQLIEGCGHNMSVIRAKSVIAGAMLKRSYTITKQGGGIRGLDIDARGYADTCLQWEAGKWQLFENLSCRNALVKNAIFGNDVSSSYRFYGAKIIHCNFATEYAAIGDPANRPLYNLDLRTYATDLEIIRCEAYGAKTANINCRGSAHSLIGVHTYKTTAGYEADYGVVFDEGGHRLVGSYVDAGWNVAGLLVNHSVAAIVGNYFAWNAGTTGDAVKFATGLSNIQFAGNIFASPPGGCSKIVYAGTRPTNSVVLVGDGSADVLISSAPMVTGGQKIDEFLPRHNEPPTSNYATFGVRNSHPYLAFDDTTAWAAVFTGTLPGSYSGRGITVEVSSMAASATTGTHGWTVEIERVDTATDLDADSFASAQTITASAVSATSGAIITQSVAIASGSAMDSLAAGESYRLRLKRDVANDTAVGNAQVTRVRVYETP